MKKEPNFPCEPLEIINQRLIDYYGYIENLPKYRVVFSDDQFEMRLTEYTDEGFKLIYPEVRELPKYRQWIKSKFILERLLEVPDLNEHELPEAKLSYECIHVFEDSSGKPLPVGWVPVRFLIDQLHYQMGMIGFGPKYKHPLSGLNNEELIEAKKEEMKLVMEDLFGNETDISDALAHNYGISMAGLGGKNIH